MKRVLHLPTPVGGMPWGLAQAERALGLDSRVLISFQDWLSYRADINLNLDKLLLDRTAKFRFKNLASYAAIVAKLVTTFFRIRSRYDVFHFNFGSSLIHFPAFFLNQVDLPFYPEEAKLFVTYNGCDARQKYPTIKRTDISACAAEKCYGGQCNSGRLDHLRRTSIEKMARYVKHMWAVNPDILHFLPPEKSSFLPYALDLAEMPLALPDFDRKRIRILHAPVNREAKGSLYILEALKRLKATHPEIEVVLVENVPHKEAVKLYRDADIVIDQVLIGWYGGFAVELMKMGKPVIARIAREDLRFLPAQMASDVTEAIIDADPHNLYEVLSHCVENRASLKSRSKAGLEYVNTWHHPRYVASITKQKYDES